MVGAGAKRICLLIGVFAGLFLSEICVLFLNHYREEGEIFFGSYPTPYFFRPDSILGYKPRNSCVVTSRKESHHHKVYEVSYKLDKFGRRVTPSNSQTAKRYFALFFGCSFTFGEGVNDNQTFPYYFSQLAADYRSYNYGFCGYGSQQMLAKITTPEFQSEIEEPGGILIYTFIEDHMERNAGSMRVFNEWGADMPCYELLPSGSLVLKGSFRTCRPIRARIYSLLGKSNILKYLSEELPYVCSSKDTDPTIAIIREARTAFLRKFPGSKFYVLLYPVAHPVQCIPSIKEQLQRLQIPYFDYSNDVSFAQSSFWIQQDFHPTPALHQLIARRLFADLGRIGAFSDPISKSDHQQDGR